MGRTGAIENVDYGLQLGHSIQIADPTHPIAAELSGVVRIISVTQWVSWGKPAAGAIPIAVLTDDPSKVAIFAYPTGARTLSGPALAARVGLFASFVEFDAFTVEALDLFEAAVRWAWAN